LPATLHASHVPVQVALQQKPSTHGEPPAHGVVALQITAPGAVPPSGVAGLGERFASSPTQATTTEKTAVTTTTDSLRARITRAYIESLGAVSLQTSSIGYASRLFKALRAADAREIAASLAHATMTEAAQDAYREAKRQVEELP
jgi:hypothetical protein